MSCLDYPRIHFNGMFSTNVCTANNDDLNGAVDPKYYPIVDTVTVALNANLASITDAEVRAWFKELTPGRQALNSGWNYYGNHWVSFDQAVVGSVQASPGSSGPVETLLIGQPVSLPGGPKMVDVDPTGSINTQIFVNRFSLGNSTFGIAWPLRRWSSRVLALDTLEKYAS